MTTRLRSSNLEQEANFDEGVGELSVEEKYAEVKQLIIVGKEKGFLLYDEIYETLPEEITSLPVGAGRQPGRVGHQEREGQEDPPGRAGRCREERS